MSTTSEIPADIYEKILDLLTDGLSKEGRHMLKKCGQVSRLLWTLSRKRLFAQAAAIMTTEEDWYAAFWFLLNLMSDPIYSITPLITTFYIIPLESFFPNTGDQSKIPQCCRMLELLAESGTLKKLLIKPNDEWTYTDGPFSRALTALLRMPSLEAVRIEGVNNLPPDIFEHAHFRDLYMEKCKCSKTSEWVPQMNGPTLAFLHTDNTFPFLDMYSGDDTSKNPPSCPKLSRLVRLTSSFASVNQLKKASIAMQNSSQTLGDVVLGAQETDDDNLPVFDFSKNEKLTNVALAISKINHSLPASYIWSKFLQPSSPCTSLHTIWITLTIMAPGFWFLGDLVGSPECQKQWSEMDQALSHPHFAHLREILLIVIFSGFSMMSGSVDQAKDQLRSFFPLLADSKGDGLSFWIIC